MALYLRTGVPQGEGDTALEVQRLGLCLPMQGCKFDSYLGSLDPTCLMPHPPKNQQKSYCNKLSKDLERVHIKNKTLKTKNEREFGHRRRVTEQTQRWQPDCRGVLEGRGSWPREGTDC